MAKDITVPITPEIYAALGRKAGLPWERCGGFQRLIIRLQSRMNPQQVTVAAEDAPRLRHYAWDYGEGTYQKQLRALVQLMEDLGLMPPSDNGQKGLFDDE